jgi:hypothetical protein
MIATHASATITQVDGTILPVVGAGNVGCDGSDNAGDSLQTCFDVYEGVSPPNANAIDQFLDAATVPEIFLPNTSQPVQFRDLAEGAGFENSFGWYNIGDDVLTPAGRAANLHRRRIVETRSSTWRTRSPARRHARPRRPSSISRASSPPDATRAASSAST